MKIKNVKWDDPTFQLSEHFTVYDALNLSQWGRLANESDGLDDTVKEHLLEVFDKLELVRNELGWPIMVHCAYRPGPYNALVKGSSSSGHLYGMAIDFHVIGYADKDACAKIRQRIRPFLEKWNIRMENHDGNWVHIDTKPPVVLGNGTKDRFFKV